MAAEGCSMLLTVEDPWMAASDLQELVEEALHTRFEIINTRGRLVSKVVAHGELEGATIFEVFFSRVVAAEIFLTIPFEQAKQRQRLLLQTVEFEPAMLGMAASPRFAYADGAPEIATIVEEIVRDAMQVYEPFATLCSGSGWCLIDLRTDVFADLLFYRSRGHPQLFLLRRRRETAFTVVPPRLRSFREALTADLRGSNGALQPNHGTYHGTSNGTTHGEVRGGRRGQRSLFIQTPPTSNAKNIRMNFIAAIKKVNPELMCRCNIVWQSAKPSSSVAGEVLLESEQAADAVMEAYLVYTEEFFNDPPVRVYRCNTYVRTPPSRGLPPEAAMCKYDTVKLMGTPPGLDPLPLKGALCELFNKELGRFYGIETGKNLVKTFCLRKTSSRRTRSTIVYVTFNSVSAVWALLSLGRPLWLSGEELSVVKWSGNFDA